MCKHSIQANGAGVEVDKGTFNMHGGEIKWKRSFQAWVEQFLVWTLLICMVAVLPAILHNISGGGVSVYKGDI